MQYANGDEKMTALIYGGAASGKSEYAEALAVKLCQGNSLVYLATMEAGEDPEIQARIVRHRRQRAGKGFLTVECPRNLTKVELPPDSTVLLEDLGNLAANALFPPSSLPVQDMQGLAGDLLSLSSCVQHLVVVSNDLTRDAVRYAPETFNYVSLLERLHQTLAARCDQVVEVVCGLPVIWKGAEL